MNYDLEKKFHISYCGSYCHICDWHTGRIRKTFQLGSDMVDNLGLRKQLGDDVDVENFKMGLRRLARSSICPGCKAEAGTHGTGRDRCEIRQCCHSKGFSLCSECPEFPCETLKSNPGVIRFRCIENLKAIKENGLKDWIDLQWKKYTTESID